MPPSQRWRPAEPVLPELLFTTMRERLVRHRRRRAVAPPVCWDRFLRPTTGLARPFQLVQRASCRDRSESISRASEHLISSLNALEDLANYEAINWPNSSDG